MPTKNEIIRNTYKKYLGSKAQTLDRIQQMDKKKSEEDEDYEPTGITKKDVDNWFKNNHQLAPALKAPYQTRYNSFVAPGPKHTLQVDLFTFKYEQGDPDFKVKPPPHGFVCVDVFTKEVNVVPMEEKRRLRGWTLSTNT